jgi:hypothetical protein
MNNQFRNVTEALQPSAVFRCPCCRFKTLCGRAQYEICEVCSWEDDGQDDHDASEVRGGPNGSLSLSKARDNFTKFGAADRKALPRVRKPLPSEL